MYDWVEEPENCARGQKSAGIDGLHSVEVEGKDMDA